MAMIHHMQMKHATGDIMDLMIRVVDIRGHCPVYQEGDVFYLKEGYILDTRRSCPVCMHSLASIMPYYTAIRHGVDPALLGLAPEQGSSARVQCLDPCAYTGGGTVVFEITRIVDEI